MNRGPENPINWVTAMSNQELLREFVVNHSIYSSKVFSPEIVIRCNKDEQLLKEVVGLFFTGDQSMRYDITSMVGQIDKRTLIPHIESMLKTLFEEEGDGMSGAEVMRLRLYEALKKYRVNWVRTLPILLNALIREEWHNNVYFSLREAIEEIGINAVPDLLELLKVVANSPENSPGERAKIRCISILLSLRVSQEDIDQIVKPKKKKGRWLW